MPNGWPCWRDGWARRWAAGGRARSTSAAASRSPGDPTGRGLRPLDDPPTPAEYAAALADGLERGLRRAGIDPAGIEVEIEPGRAIYGNSGLHLATVLNVKRQSAPVRPHLGRLRQLGGAAQRPQLGAQRLAADLRRTGGRRSGRGGRDRAQLRVRHDRGRRLAALADRGRRLIAFLATGAYEEALAGNFNSIPQAGLGAGQRRRGRADPPPRDRPRRGPARPRARAAARRRHARAGGRSRRGVRWRTSTVRWPSTATCWAWRCGNAECSIPAWSSG